MDSVGHISDEGLVKARLRLRGPAWLIAPLGVLAASGVGGAVIAFVGALAFSLPLVPLFAGGVGVLAVVLASGLLLVDRAERSTPALLSVVLSVGHAAMFVAFLAAAVTPSAVALSGQWTQAVGLAIELGPTPSPFLVVGQIYIAAFTVYSVIAPLSLILFRYGFLTKR